MTYTHLFVFTNEYCLYWNDITKSMMLASFNYVNIYNDLQGTKFSNYLLHIYQLTPHGAAMDIT